MFIFIILFFDVDKFLVFKDAAPIDPSNPIHPHFYGVDQYFRTEL